ncbi:MAG: DsrE family protein, partial [Saprospiraceae bacterium]
TPTKEERYAKMQNKLVYPLIKGSYMTGVMPILFANDHPSSKKKIKLIFDFTQSTANKAQGTHVNEGLEEVARILNLHVAAGYKKENIKTVIVFHSGSIISILNDSYYASKYQSDNPNKEMLGLLSGVGASFVVCGQSASLREIGPSEFLPEIKFAVSARTTLTKYQDEGYILFAIGEH